VRAAGVVEADLEETSESGSPLCHPPSSSHRDRGRAPAVAAYTSFTHSNALRPDASARRRSTAGGKGGGST
jgi:hypothetical protein